MADIANTCLQADSDNTILPSRQIATKEIDAITLMGQPHDHMISGNKRQIKTGFVVRLWKNL